MQKNTIIRNVSKYLLYDTMLTSTQTFTISKTAVRTSTLETD